MSDHDSVLMSLPPPRLLPFPLPRKGLRPPPWSSQQWPVMRLGRQSIHEHHLYPLSQLLSAESVGAGAGVEVKQEAALEQKLGSFPNSVWLVGQASGHVQANFEGPSAHTQFRPS